MALFFPEWIPWWLQLAIVGVVVIFGICFLLMPFSVLGLKSRLTYLDHQMEDIQSQLRVLLKRIPDARERLEFKLQPISSKGEASAVRKDESVKEQQSANASSEYYTAVPSIKNRPVCFDPPPESQRPPVRTQVKTSAYEEEWQFSGQERSRDRRPVSVPEKNTVNTERRGEKIYNPPAQSAREEKQEELQPRRRAEPILRWPPR